MKVCTRCNKPRPLDEFPVKKTMRDGRHSWCRECFSTYYKTWDNVNFLRRRLLSIKYRAKKHGRPFSITIADVVIPTVCPILGIPLRKQVGQHPRPDSPSLDCVIPALGYVPGNVQVISYRANCIKNDGTAEEHEAIVAYIRRFTSPHKLPSP